MNKKILLSVAAAATLAMTFTGCGSSDDTVASSGSTTNSSGYTTVGATTVGASKGALSGARVTINGTSVTATGGTDVISDTVFTGSVKSDTTLTDSEGRVITNTFTNLAIASGDDNATRALNSVAAKLGYANAEGLKKVFQANAADALLENVSRLLQRQYEANPSAITEIIKYSTETSISGLLTEMNTETGEVNATKFADMISATNLALNPTQFANTLAAYDANTSVDFNTTLAANTVTYSGISLDTNGSFTTGNLFNLGSLSDTNVTSATVYGDYNETGEILLSIENLAEDSINSNASYALKLSKLTVNSSASNVLSFALNDNTSLALTANSNMSIATTFNESNLTQITNFIGADFDGIDFNATDLIARLSNLVGTELDTNESNFTSGMLSTSDTYSVKALMNVNDINITTADKNWLIEKDSINIGADNDYGTNGTSYAGYKVLDGNLTK